MSFPGPIHVRPAVDSCLLDLGRWVDHTLYPATDAMCRRTLDDAIAILVAFRAGKPDHPAPLISTLVSLIVEADSRLPDAVADARELGHTWDDISSRLGTTIPAARHRFAQYLRWRREGKLAGIL